MANPIRSAKVLLMDVDEYLKMVKPGSNRSRLAPYWEEIKELRSKGYTLEQVRAFLKLNDVEISIGSLSKYIKRRQAKKTREAAPAASAPASADRGDSESAPTRQIHNPGDLYEVMKQEVDLDDYQ